MQVLPRLSQFPSLGIVELGGGGVGVLFFLLAVHFTTVPTPITLGSHLGKHSSHPLFS